MELIRGDIYGIGVRKKILYTNNSLDSNQVWIYCQSGLDGLERRSKPSSEINEL